MSHKIELMTHNPNVDSTSLPVYTTNATNSTTKSITNTLKNMSTKNLESWNKKRKNILQQPGFYIILLFLFFKFIFNL